MLLLNLNRESPTPLWQQITAGVQRLVDDGTLTPGTRLPPSRVLADRLTVNRSTVLRAYQELWALGYLESRPGSYSTVRRRMRPAGATQKRAASGLDWERASAPAAARVFAEYQRFTPAAAGGGAAGVVDFSGLAADRTLAPVEEFRRVAQTVLREEGRALLDYGSPAGHGPLREAVAWRLRTHGVAVTAEEVMITSGAQHGLDLALRLLAPSGSRVVVERPTYSAAIPLLALHGVEVVEVPMTTEGMDLDRLEDVLASQHPALVYTVPTFHNPTGITTAQAHRERLLALAERHGVPLLEDGFEEEMKYFGRLVLPIKSMDASGVVVYLGTFSKVLFPGLRVGWIAAPRECIARLVAINRFAALSSPPLGQAVLARLCRESRFEAHLRRVHTAYRKRMALMLRCLREHLDPQRIHWTQPGGGYTLWVTVRACPVEEPALLHHLRSSGVLTAPGSTFFASPAEGVHFRLSISNLDEPAIQEGIRRLASSLAEVLA